MNRLLIDLKEDCHGEIVARINYPKDAGAFVLSAALLERIYLAMEQAAPPPQTPFDTCPTCEALARTVMMDQTGAA